MKKRSLYALIILFSLLLGVDNLVFAQKGDLRYAGDSVEAKESRKLGGWIDVQYRFEQDAEGESSVVQIRRARLDYKGSLSNMIDYRLQADFAPSPRLIDAYIKLNFRKYAQLQVGQFKIPFSLENKLSPLDLELTDNAQIISALSGYKDVTGIASYANGREIGAMITGELAFVEVRNDRIPLLSYGVGLFGGNGINVKTDNLAKDVAARIEFRPLVRNLVLSVSGYWGSYEMLYNNAPTDMSGARIRYANGMQYSDRHWMVRAEYLKGKTGFVGFDDSDGIFTPYYVETQGCYLIASYWFEYGRRQTNAFQQKISPIIRVDYFEKDMASHTSSLLYSSGVDWWPEKHLRLQLAYTLQQKIPSNQLGHTITTMVTVRY